MKWSCLGLPAMGSAYLAVALLAALIPPCAAAVPKFGAPEPLSSSTIALGSVRVEETSTSFQLVCWNGGTIYGVTPSGAATVLAAPFTNVSNGINGQSMVSTTRLPDGELVAAIHSTSNSSSPQHQQHSNTWYNWSRFGTVTTAMESSSNVSGVSSSAASRNTLGEAIPSSGPSYFFPC